MPGFDSSRDRFRLAMRHLNVLGRLYDGERVPAELVPARDELRAAGLVNDEDAVAPELAELTHALAEPVVLVQLEITGGEGVTVNGAVIGNDACYVYESWPGEEESEYVRTDPGTLVWSLARAVGLRDRDAKPPVAPVIRSTVGVMDAGFSSFGTVNATSAEEAAERLSEVLAAESGLTDPELTVFTHLMLQLNATWRMTVAWQNKEGTGTDVQGITVFDCGPLGHWLRELPAEPILPGAVIPESELKLIFVDARRLWELITDLIPDTGQLPAPVRR